MKTYMKHFVAPVTTAKRIKEEGGDAS